MKTIGLIGAMVLLTVPSVASARRVATTREEAAMRSEIRRDLTLGSGYRIHGFVLSTIHTAPTRYGLVGYVATNRTGGGLIQMRRGARGWRILAHGSSVDPCVFPNRVQRDLMPGFPCRPTARAGLDRIG